jgi:uncharacterized membrane protein
MLILLLHCTGIYNGHHLLGYASMKWCTIHHVFGVSYMACTHCSPITRMVIFQNVNWCVCLHVLQFLLVHYQHVLVYDKSKSIVNFILQYLYSRIGHKPIESRYVGLGGDAGQTTYLWGHNV